MKIEVGGKYPVEFGSGFQVANVVAIYKKEGGYAIKWFWGESAGGSYQIDSPERFKERMMGEEISSIEL